VIILLNGTSSSGKSSLANALRESLPEPYFLFGIDDFLEKSMPLHLNFEKESDFQQVLAAVSGFHQALGAMAPYIPFMLIDHVLQSHAWFDEVATALQGHPTYVVQVKASLSTLEAREALRPDRKPGTAREQYETVYSLPYDLSVNTEQSTPVDCAQQIQQSLSIGTALKTRATKP
jgi:chloramphenicol 3-O phosphotransferase